MRKSWKFIALGSAAICIFGLAGCGSDNDNNDTSPLPPKLAITANSDDDTVTIFNAKTLAVVHDSITVDGDFPWEITLSTDGNAAYVMNRYSNNISIINMNTGTETGTITLTGSEPAKAVIASDGYLYVCYFASGFISKVNISSATPVEDSTIAVSNSSNWSAIAATPAGDVLYVGSSSPAVLSRVDIVTAAETNSWTAGDNIPTYIWDIKIDSAGLAYLASYDVGQTLRWDTITDTFAAPVENGQPYEWMVDMALEGTTLFGTYNAGSSNGGVVMIDTMADFARYTYSQADDESYDVTLPFTFNFLGTDYTTATVNSNGGVSFSGYVDYDSNMDGILGFFPNNEDLDSGDGYIFNYSSQLFDDHAVFQWSTATNDDDPNPNTVTIFEVVLFNDGRARIDYAFSMPDAINEDDGYLFGIGDGSLTPIVDMRALLGSPFEVERRSFLWNPAVSTTSVTEVPFEWEGTAVLPLPVYGLPHGVAVTADYIFIPLSKVYDPATTTGTASTTVAVYDRSTGLPVAPITVGSGPRAIAIQP